MEPRVLSAQPQDVAIVGDDALEAAPVLGLVHLAQKDVQRAAQCLRLPPLYP